MSQQKLFYKLFSCQSRMRTAFLFSIRQKIQGCAAFFTTDSPIIASAATALFFTQRVVIF